MKGTIPKNVERSFGLSKTDATKRGGGDAPSVKVFFVGKFVKSNQPKEQRHLRCGVALPNPSKRKLRWLIINGMESLRERKFVKVREPRVNEINLSKVQDRSS